MRESGPSVFLKILFAQVGPLLLGIVIGLLNGVLMPGIRGGAGVGGAVHKMDARHAIIVVLCVEQRAVGEFGFAEAIGPVEAMWPSIDAYAEYTAVDIQQGGTTIPLTTNTLYTC